MCADKRSREPKKKDLPPTGLQEIDRLATLKPCTISDYVLGVSAYVRLQSKLAAGPKKASQIRLSNALARALAEAIEVQLPSIAGKLVTEERKIAGGLRTAKADLSESHPLDGLRLAVEIKPINLAVGRAIWNRFGDIRTFAVNIHLKFRFAVVGGVLVVPIYEETGTTAAREAEAEEEAREQDEIVSTGEGQSQTGVTTVTSTSRKSTVHLIARAIERLHRAGGRKSEAESDHLLEGIAVIVYDPDTGTIDPNLPKPGLGLRWDEFITNLVTAYRARFED
jgi:hypothetical protein